MTAIVDLVVVGKSKILSKRGAPCHDTRFVFTYFTDSTGTYDNPNGDKGIFLDTLFGSGPKRYGLKTHKRVTYVKNPPKDNIGTTYSVYRNELLEQVEASQKKRRVDRKKLRKEFGNAVPPKPTEGALNIREFLSVLHNIPSNSEFWSLHNSRPMYGFLKELSEEELLVMPLIGHGLSWEFPDYFGGHLGASTIIGFWGIP